MKKRSIVIPHEHGGWAMVSVPFILGMMICTPHRMHIPLFIAWFLFYLASYPLLQAVKKRSNRTRMIKWGAGYGMTGLLFSLPPLIYEPQLLYFSIPLALLLLINIWHAKRKAERAIMNDLCAILSFSIAAAAAYLLGGGQWNQAMLFITLFTFLYFLGTAFFIKTIFRERMNKRWRLIAYIFHVIILFIPLAVGYPLMMIPFLYAAARAFIFAGKQLRPMKAGIIEIIGAVQFLILSIFLFNV